MSENKKYYWLKLHRDFFRRHDIRIIESMANGKDYILFYLKLLCESTSHEGNLRFSDTVPYSEDMLATITNTNIDIVKQAITIFEQLNMLEILEDNTIYLNEVTKMLGQTEVDIEEQRRKNCERQKRHREKVKLLSNGDSNVTVTLHSNVEKELDIEKDKDIKKNIKKKKTAHGRYGHVLLTSDEYEKLSKEYSNANELIEYLDEAIEMKGYKYKSHYLAIKKWVVDAVNEKRSKRENKNNPYNHENNGKEIPF